MNLFSVTSPFQYICALEAKAHYQTQNNILLLVEQLSEPGLSQQKKLVDDSDWDYIMKIPRTNRTRNLPKAIKEIWGITKNKQIENFFHAEYNGWRTKLLLRNLNINKEIYFDDGTLTINEYEESIRPMSAFYRPRFIQDLIVRLRGCKPIGRLPQSTNLEIFTIFDIPDPKHTIKKNKLTVLKKKYNISTLYNAKAPIGFIGQGAIGHKRRKTIEQYLKEIKFFIEKNENGIIYFPHRTESPELKKEVEKIPGVIYHYSELPLEIELVDKKIELSGLVGILSTVQYTTTILYKNMPVYNLNFNMDTEEASTLNQERNRRIHDTFILNGIKDIQL
ncbi:glycosyltransferase 52 family protein [Vibrio vulnificus]|nr:glycosyltransferase 52 family protein [Vibrio vulnificus]